MDLVLIGIDVGTSSVRSCALEPCGRRVASAARPTPLVPRETGGEFDPDAIMDAVTATLAEVAMALAGRPVAGIAVASLGESSVSIDVNGRPLANAILWHDRRTIGEVALIEKALGRERIFAITGHAAEPIFSLCKLLWMRRHWPHALDGAHRILMMADWVAYKLSGVAATDPTLASRSLYFDIGRREWSAEMLQLAGVTPEIGAPIRAAGTALAPMLPDMLAATGLAGRPVVGVGGHDHIVGGLAVGLAEPGAIVDSIGTAEAVLLAAPRPLRDPSLIANGFVQGAIEAENSLSYLAGSLLSAGGAIEWVRRVTGGRPAEELRAEAEAVPAGSHGVVFLPQMASGPPPAPDAFGRGAFVGLTPQTTPAALYRAAMEGVAMQARLLLDGMLALDGVGTPGAIRLIGGATRNRLFLKIKANAYGRSVIVVEETEATALGAALLGGVAAGLFRDIGAAVAGLDRREFTIEPDADADRYDAIRSQVFAPAVESIRATNSAIHRVLG